MAAQGSSGRETDYVDEKAVAAAEEEIRQHMKPLEDQGVINLDAPARQVIDEITRRLQDPKNAEGRKPAAEGGYWLVGSKGWCNHLND